MSLVFFRGNGAWVFLNYHQHGTTEYKVGEDFHVCGVFKLSDGDALDYAHTKELSRVRELTPASEIDDNFYSYDFLKHFHNEKDFSGNRFRFEIV